MCVTYILVLLVDVAVGWLDPAWVVVVANQKFVTMKRCLDGHRYQFSYELYYIYKVHS